MIHTHDRSDRRPPASSLLSFVLSTTRIGRNMTAIIIGLQMKVNRQFAQISAALVWLLAATIWQIS